MQGQQKFWYDGMARELRMTKRGTDEIVMAGTAVGNFVALQARMGKGNNDPGVQFCYFVCFGFWIGGPWTLASAGGFHVFLLGCA